MNLINFLRNMRQKLNSNLTIERTIIKSYTNPPLNWIENLIEVIF